MRNTWLVLPASVVVMLAISAIAQDASGPVARVLTGSAALGDWRADAPLVRRRITVDDLPRPFATRSAENAVRLVPPPSGASPKLPPGFKAELLVADLRDPRALAVAPNGDLFVAESEPGRIRVVQAGDAAPGRGTVFASGLDHPFGMAFYPPGPDPQWIYIANVDSVVRFAFRAGDLRARRKPEVVVPRLGHGSRHSADRGHITRDIVFSSDGQRMFVSVGSATDVGEGMGKRNERAVARWDREHGVGSAWGIERDRAAVLTFDPEGKGGRVFASGLRNCVGLAMHPRTGELWCSVNEGRIGGRPRS